MLKQMGKVGPIGHLPFKFLRITLIRNYIKDIYNFYLQHHPLEMHI